MKDLTTDLMDSGEPEEVPPKDESTPREPRFTGATRIVVLVIAAIVVIGIGGLLAYFILDRWFGTDAPDYPGPGNEPEVVVEVVSGETVAEIGETLVAEDVILSVQAFTDAARRNNDANSIQVGFFSMLQQMKASDALDRLLDPASRVEEGIVIPEGFTVAQVFERSSEETGIPESEFEAVESDPSALPLPDWASEAPDVNRLEGFLFPATYPTDPGTTAESLLSSMVANFNSTAEGMEFAEEAPANGVTPYEALVVASIAEREAGVPEDLGKVARVIYNRLEAGMPLQMDSTVNYALGTSDIRLSDADVGVDSPYNTYQVTGLPPTPIANPGEAAMEAAINPPEGDWIYFVLCDTDGSSCFTSDYDQFLEDKARAKEEGIF